MALLRRSGFVFLFFALLVPIQAQAPGGQPDVLILVYQMPGGQDEVGITYARAVPHSRALRDLHALQGETGWNANGLQIADAVGPMHSRMGKMTSVSFASPGVAPYESHAFPIEPFIEAFRDYPHIVLAFVTDRGFQFQGLRNYADNHVQIALEQHDAAYTYRIHISDPHFDRLKLPTVQLDTPAGTVAAAARTSKYQIGFRQIALLLLIALAVGFGVYVITARLGRTPLC